MTIIQKALAALKNYLRAFVRRSDERGHSDPMNWNWVNDPFFTEHQRKTEKLASLARYIEGAKTVVLKRKKNKKRHSDVLAAIAQAQNERLMIETGRMVYDPAFGAWVVKGEK